MQDLENISNERAGTQSACAEAFRTLDCYGRKSAMVSWNRRLKRITSTFIAPAIIGLVGLASTAQAMPITYTFTGTGAFVFNGGAYSDQLVTFTVVADTDGVAISQPGTHDDDLGLTAPFNAGITTVTVGGISDTLLDFPSDQDKFGPRTAVAQFPTGLPGGSTPPAVVLFGLSGYGIIGVIDNAFGASYTLDQSMAPVTYGGGGTTYDESNQEASSPTASGGQFYWRTAPTSVTFSAVTTATSVPEPGTLALFGLGLAGAAFARRRKAM
jgi:PEP-CTERM motif